MHAYIGLHTPQHIKLCTTTRRMIKITAVQDIVELHHIVYVSEFVIIIPGYIYTHAFFILHAGVCPSLSLSVSNGKVIITSTLDGGTASYSCNPRYEVDGAAVLTCQSSGSWSSQVPTCRRKCKHQIVHVHCI